MTARTAEVQRDTGETEVAVRLTIDGTGASEVETGIPFFDHMLGSVATHGLFDLAVEATGDLAVDEHHTVEDVGIVLGRAIDEALADRTGIERFADRRIPLDEAVASVVIDVSGRPLFEFEGGFSQPSVGGFTSQLAPHFWRSVSTNAGLTTHASVRGANAHHEIEALFKAFGRALDDATRQDERRSATPSTKGALE